MADEIKLPPLPDTGWNLCFFNEEGDTVVAGVGYTEANLQAYAQQAIEAYKEQQQGLD